MKFYLFELLNLTFCPHIPSYTLLPYKYVRKLSSNYILAEIRANLEKNQEARTELYAILDKPYYVESMKYKVDAAPADDEDDR
jgi:hypothetical protein